MFNVLVTCVGRRNYLVAFFREALAGRGYVYGADADPYASGLQECDRAFVVGRAEEPGYVDEILALCREYNVRLLVPLLDLELPVVARQRERFLAVQTIPVVSTSSVVDLCFDKWATLGFLRDCGLAGPRTYLTADDACRAIREGELRLPVVVKPRWGSASLGLEYAADEEEVRMSVRLLEKRLPRTILARASMNDPDRSVLIQERLSGQEYGLDVVNDLSGRYKTTFIRRKLSMRCGETERATTVACRRLSDVGRTIGQTLRHVGNLDCDVFVTEDECRVLEMNPRFGGGYPFSHVAGANLPAMMIAWANGAPLDPAWMRVEPDVTAAKCDRVVVTSHPGFQRVCAILPENTVRDAKD